VFLSLAAVAGLRRSLLASKVVTHLQQHHLQHHLQHGSYLVLQLEADLDNQSKVSTGVYK